MDARRLDVLPTSAVDGTPDELSLFAAWSAIEKGESTSSRVDGGESATTRRDLRDCRHQPLAVVCRWWRRDLTVEVERRDSRTGT